MRMGAFPRRARCATKDREDHAVECFTTKEHDNARNLAAELLAALLSEPLMIMMNVCFGKMEYESSRARARYIFRQFTFLLSSVYYICSRKEEWESFGKNAKIH